VNGAFHVGAVGLQAQQRALEVVSNNIANVNTPTFKRTDVRFVEMLAIGPDAEVPAANAALTITGATTGATASGVAARSALAMDEGGTIEATGRPMDLAIRGRGFIELAGPGGRTLLWRGGALKTLEDGTLAAADSGLPLRAALSMPTGASDLVIEADGTVRATGAEAESVEIGQITLVTPRDVDAVRAIDGGLFEVPEAADLDELPPGEDGAGTLVQGGIERSNVEMTTQMVELMLLQRAYAANAQVVQAADQMMATANGLRR